MQWAYGGVEVHGHGGFVRKQKVKKARDVAKLLNIMRIHRERCRQCEKWLSGRHVFLQFRIHGLQNRWQQVEMRRRAGKGRKHKVAEPQERQPGDGLCSRRGTEDEEEKLDDVVVALEIA